MKRVRSGLLLIFAGATLGCGHAPEFNVLGSYFPGWIACGIAAIVLTVGVRFLLRWMDVERVIKALPLFYLAVAAIFASLLWLLIFE